MSRVSRVASASLVLLFAARSAFPQERVGPIRAAAANAAVAAAEQSTDRRSRPALFWSGVALGVAGVTTAVLGVTVARVETSSTGNAPNNAFQSCVALKSSDPIYGTSRCDALKGKNRAVLWSGVAIGAAGAALVIADHGLHAEIAGGCARIFHTVRF